MHASPTKRVLVLRRQRLLGLALTTAIVVVPLSAEAAGCRSIESFGGAADNHIDNSAAWSTAIKTFGLRNGCLSFGPGTYRFKAKVSASLSATSPQTLTIRGAGQSGTILYWPNPNGGLSVTQGSVQDSVTIEDLSMMTGQPAGGQAISLKTSSALGVNAQNTLLNVTISGYDAHVGRGSAAYWSDGIAVTNVSYLNLYGVSLWGADIGDATLSASISGTTLTATAVSGSIAIGQLVTCKGCAPGAQIAAFGTGTGGAGTYELNTDLGHIDPEPAWTSSLLGTGLSITGTNDTTLGAVAYNINAATFERLALGILYNEYAQGLSVSQSNFTGVVDGIFAVGHLGHTQAQLSITSNQFNAFRHQVVINSDVADIIVLGNLFYVPNANSGLLISAGQRILVVGNSFVCTDGGANDAVRVTDNDPANAGVITGNTIQNCTNGVVLAGATPESASFTGLADASGLLTTTTVTGTITIGQLIKGAGLGPGAAVAEQLSGAPGGAGVYRLTTAPPAALPPEKMTSAFNGSSGWNVQANAYFNVAVKVTDRGANNRVGGGSE
jgi:hypothetical protein